MKTVVIVPTYNERNNVEKLIHELQRQFQCMPHDMHILVVDDSSPDGTGQVVKDLQAQYANLHLISGSKAGLGAAYIRGMKYCMDVLAADAVFEMDADFSHKPQDVPRLMVNLEHGADFVIGSRYVPGGTIPREWGAMRRANSLFGNIVARYIAGMYSVRDCTAGFRAIKTALLKLVSLDELGVQGYAFQVALLHRAIAVGAKVVEVPVDFVDRTVGESKLGLRDIVEFIVNAWWIRFQASRTFIKFALVGLTGVAVNLGLFAALTTIGLNKFVASPLAVEASIVSNFLLNNHWTFRWRQTADGFHAKGVKFNAVSLIALGISYSTFIAMSFMHPHGSPVFHQLVGIVPATFLNYFLNSYWTFRPVDKTS